MPHGDDYSASVCADKTERFQNDEPVLCSHFEMADGFCLPNTYKNRPVWALWKLKRNPDQAQVDTEGLVWMQCPQDGFWYSIAGNYSSYSPEEKIIRQGKREIEQEQQIETAKEYYDRVIYQSQIRQAVLDRDEHTCQICGKVKTTRLHVHHILKRVSGGTDHLDNLITVCPSCHNKADKSLYDPCWINVREDIV